ncbi:MAG: 3'(2'),5'-bisphosphate nucleotidase CysQ [Rhodospirillaceae bacterium]
MTLNITVGLMEIIGDLAKRAGQEVMKYYGTNLTVDEKADESPVTEADRAAEALITDHILKNISNAFPIIGEEAFAEGRAPELDDGPFWLVDALDGTKEFIKNGTDFTVNIALIENAKPVLGVVHAPAKNETYWGSAYGAFVEMNDEAPRLVACRRPTEDGLTAVVSKSHRTEQEDAYLSKLKIKREVSAGSSLKFGMIAAGRADIYPRMGRTMEWDTAAGHAIVIYGGGYVLDMNGSPLRYGKPGFENPQFVATGKEPRKASTLRAIDLTDSKPN